ncbi:hypothetical protein E2C01_022148 [Portunus trituberculatus]|uniref:Uncharacterized protein n=1 Tax=Portunus trituberculatus TaxID=210409 RepID=A0A5B7E4F2_PORTR|nr:hypothetical protein [Portunus trituberculatus]
MIRAAASCTGGRGPGRRMAAEHEVNNHFTETTAGEGGTALIISGAGGKADPSSPYLVYIITEGEAREGASAGRGLRTPQATRAASVHQSERRGGVSGSVVHLPCSNTSSRAAGVPCRRQLCPSPALTGQTRWREREEGARGVGGGKGKVLTPSLRTSRATSRMPGRNR